MGAASHSKLRLFFRDLLLVSLKLVEWKGPRDGSALKHDSPQTKATLFGGREGGGAP
jgi:hypothetical protein